MKPALNLFAAAAFVALHGAAPAEPARSLNDVRSQINSGTWPGITLIEARPKAAPAGSPTAGSETAASAPAVAAAAGSTSIGERLRALLGRGAPASGVPMNQATRLDSPDIGIVLPTGAATAGAAPAPPGAGK